MDTQTSTKSLQMVDNEMTPSTKGPQCSEPYRAPRVVTLGKAVSLVQRNSVGQFQDAPGAMSRVYY